MSYVTDIVQVEYTNTIPVFYCYQDDYLTFHKAKVLSDYTVYTNIIIQDQLVVYNDSMCFVDLFQPDHHAFMS